MKKQLDALGKLRVPSASSYFGIVDLCGFKKDRFYIYQARWRPELPMAHILPHWNWPERVGQVTPVHVYTSGDEAELFLNGKSLGRKKKGQFEYRLRWDDVVYQPGTLEVVAYRRRQGVGPGQGQDDRRAGTALALASIGRDPGRRPGPGLRHRRGRRSGRAAPFRAATTSSSSRSTARARSSPWAMATPTSHEPFQARQRKAFNGLCQVIVAGQLTGREPSR